MMYWVYVAPRKDVLGVHSFLEGCVGNMFENWTEIFMMTSHMNCMLVCNAGEMLKICTGCTWFLRRMYKCA